AWYAGKEPKYEQWEKIRDLYSDALGMDGARFLDPRVEATVAARLNLLNDRLVFSPYMPVRGAQMHTVKSGENLTTIARRYNLDTWRSLAEVNHVNPATLRVGDRLKVVTGRVFILVNKRTFTLSWYLDGVFVRRYRCATGAVGSETPPGRYKIVRMDVNPEWRDPNTGKIYKYGEPGHAIGSRWMAMEGEGTHGLGIHGTIDPDSMGKKASNGCIRLLKKDVEELYGFVSIQRGNESEVLVLE
ncbi:MAG: L,D-transpeptidase family protein, partial [Planctomycetes bacterium]|nr:L,D-transpeptidase family protein [Planctomycetota bacterium]